VRATAKVEHVPGVLDERGGAAAPSSCPHVAGRLDHHVATLPPRPRRPCNLKYLPPPADNSTVV